MIPPLLAGALAAALVLAPSEPPVPHHRWPLPEVRTGRSGLASTYGPGWDGWTALPGGPGTRARVCGPAACVTVRANNAGPSLAMQRLGRLVDLDVPTFAKVCGCRWTRGLVRVTVRILP